MIYKVWILHKICWQSTSQWLGRWREKEQISLKAEKQKSSSCDDGKNRKDPRVQLYVYQPYALNFDTHPVFIGLETSIVFRLEHNPQTDEA